MKKLQITLQIFFLALFAFLAITGKAQVWVGVFIAGLIVSLFFGRLYCGWVCPINTLAGSITRIKRKLRLRNRTPEFLKKPVVRYTVFALFIGVFVLTMVSGKKLPVLPALLIIGAVLTILFTEELWHRYLCPYGTLFHFVARKPLYGMNINDTACTNCGMCSKVCPAGAVDKKDGYYKIKGNACLLCFDCTEKCGQKAIFYEKTNTTAEKKKEIFGQKTD